MQVRYLPDEHVEIFYMKVGKEANIVKQEYFNVHNWEVEVDLGQSIQEWAK